jgi:hypothetical protein
MQSTEKNMAIYVVTWNLNKEGAAYQQARVAFLKQLGAYDNVQESQLETVRWISTSDTAHQVSDYLLEKLDNNDRLFVSEIRSGTHQGWLNQTTWDWINARL